MQALRLQSCAAIGAVLLASVPAEAKQNRSHIAIAEFKRQQPCPATGRQKGSCPGWIIDHVHPLCAGGTDAPINMQWQTVSDAKTKDRVERKMCKVTKRRHYIAP